MNRQIINVFYPADGGKILLRTEKDWDRNVEPTRSDEGGTEFLIETDRPFFYFNRYFSEMVSPNGRGAKISWPSQRLTRR